VLIAGSVRNVLDPAGDHLGAERGTEVVLSADGKGAQDALDVLARVIETSHDAS
jgi:phosphotransferase system HPr-like phosphotransfer protein